MQLLGEERIAWHIEARHLDEVEFCCELWLASLDSPTDDLERVVTGCEDRMLAHVDALQIGGPLVAARLLIPALEDSGSMVGLVAGAGLALLSGSEAGTHLERILELLDAAEDEDQHTGLVTALTLSDAEGLGARLVADLHHLPKPAVATRLDILAARHDGPGEWLLEFLADDDASVAAAAVRLAAWSQYPAVLDAVKPSMRAADLPRRAAAIETGLRRGIDGAWPAAVELAFALDPSAARQDALGWITQLGDAHVHARVLTLLDDPLRRREPLWALGFGGRPAAVERALELLDDERTAPLAGELIATITGLSSRDDEYFGDRPREQSEDEALPPLAEDQLDADLVPDAEARLRVPRPAALRHYWSHRRGSFDPSLRYLGGRPQGLAAVLDALTHAPMWRRHALAFELACRSRGAASLDTRTLARRQREQLRGFARLPPLDFQAGWAHG